MPRPRAAKVDELVRAALAGMGRSTDDFSGDEMVSACFTLTKRAMQAVLETHPEARYIMRTSLEEMLMECADPLKAN